MRRRTPEEAVDYILANAVQQGDCLISNLRKDDKGYARIRFIEETRAHIVVFFRGRLPVRPRPHVLHTCDNRACVERRHLYAGTNKQNIADKVSRDRSGKKLNIRKARRILAMLKLGRTQTEIGRRFGVAQSSISRMKTGARWAHVRGV